LLKGAKLRLNRSRSELWGDFVGRKEKRDKKIIARRHEDTKKKKEMRNARDSAEAEEYRGGKMRKNAGGGKVSVLLRCSLRYDWEW
jgi:hypothetical protein